MNMHSIAKILVTSIAVMLTTYLLPNDWVAIQSYGLAFVVAIVLALLNTFVKPLLIIFTIPITLFTLGLFLLAINAIIILIADYLIEGFYVSGFWVALLFSLILSVVNSLLESLLITPGKVD